MAACSATVGAIATFYPDSLDVMGWRIEEDGFGVLFSRDTPALVREQLRDYLREEKMETAVSAKIDELREQIEAAGPWGASAPAPRFALPIDLLEDRGESNALGLEPSLEPLQRGSRQLSRHEPLRCERAR